MKRLTKKRNLDQDLAFKEEAEALLGGQVVAMLVSKEAVGVVVSVKIPISNPEIGLVQVKLVDRTFLQDVRTASDVEQLALQALAAVDQISTSSPAIGPVLMLLALPTISQDVPIVSDVVQLVMELPEAVGLVALLAVKILQDLVTGHVLMPPVAIPTLPFVQNAIAVTLLALMGAATQLVVAVAEDSEEEAEIVDAGHSVAEAAAEVHSVAIEEAEDEGVLEIEEGGAASGEGVVAVRALILKPLVQGKTKR